MKTAIGHLRANLIAYLALFVALGGTGYAAISIPAGSVGTRQLRDGAVTAKKLDRHSIAGYVAYWARIDATGRVLAASAPTRTVGWSSGDGGMVVRQVVPKNCIALANVTPLRVGYVSLVSTQAGRNTDFQVTMAGSNGLSTPLPVSVAEVCP